MFSSNRDQYKSVRRGSKDKSLPSTQPIEGHNSSPSQQENAETQKKAKSCTSAAKERKRKRKDGGDDLAGQQEAKKRTTDSSSKKAIKEKETRNSTEKESELSTPVTTEQKTKFKHDAGNPVAEKEEEKKMRETFKMEDPNARLPTATQIGNYLVSGDPDCPDQKNLPEEQRNRVYREEFKRYFVLFAMASMLLRTKIACCRYQLMKSLMNVDDIKTYNRCKLALECRGTGFGSGEPLDRIAVPERIVEDEPIQAEKMRKVDDLQAQPENQGDTSTKIRYIL
ncbi:OLC1v1015283C1 [Oldenlandia corymbosa var. corymbosa]|uniref:OLC1v1015283C1 n=1 Tax=Oldenlandia corymbosa var. corymbosa TaxID=529605 RepID=A0AAV1E350_OLDCO|nr:OLC1v1015283C1 [Oldenlandia corymbosa var. corymbosa]